MKRAKLTETVNIVVTPEVKKHLHALAEMEEVGISVIVRKAVKKFLKEQDTAMFHLQQPMQEEEERSWEKCLQEQNS